MYAGKKIKQLRQKLELTQEAFAHELNVSRPYYSSIESGKKEITSKMLSLIKDKWGVPDYYFTTKDAELEDRLLGVKNGGNNGGVVVGAEKSDDDTTSEKKEIDERGIVLIHREFSDTMNNLLSICYLIRQQRSDYFTEDDYKNLLLLDEAVLSRVFDVINGKTTMKAYERKLRLYLEMANGLLHDYIIDLRAISVGAEPGDQIVGSFKSLYEDFKSENETD